MMAYATKLSRPLLGPFWEPDTGEEIIPATTAATDRVVEMALGTYRIQSPLPSAPMMNVAITPRLLTAFIQRDLDRVFSGQRPGKGFLIAYQGSAAAVGRMVEELIAKMLMRRIKWRGEKATSVKSVAEAQELRMDCSASLWRAVRRPGRKNATWKSVAGRGQGELAGIRLLGGIEAKSC
jgi:hypothetical protein